MLDIEVIKKRAEAATKGPWTFIPEDRDNRGAISPVCTFGNDYSYYPTAGQLYDEADGYFMAHARTDIPSLIAELERTRAAAKELREALANYATEADCRCNRVDDTHTEPCASVIKAFENTKWLKELG